MGGLASFTSQFGSIAGGVFLVFVVSQILILLVVRLQSHIRSNRKHLIERLEYSEYFFEKIAGKKVQPLVMERAIEALTGDRNVKVHELEFFLHLDNIDKKIRLFIEGKRYLEIGMGSWETNQLRFIAPYQTASARKWYIRKYNLKYCFYSFISLIAMYGLAINDSFFSKGVWMVIAVGFCLVAIGIAIHKLDLVYRMQDAERLYQEVESFFADRQSDVS